MNPNQQPVNQMPPPSQPPPQQPGGQPNPYDFINSSPGNQPQPKISGPTSTKGRIIVVAIGLVVLIILAIIISSVLGSSGRAQTDKYLEVAKREAEIVRISTMAESEARSLEIKSLATTAKLTFTSAQSDTSKLLTSRGINSKSLSKELTASKNSKTDELLEEAKTNNRYDETYKDILNSEINNYLTQINSAAGGASGAEVELLQTAFNNAQTFQGKQETEKN